MIRNVLICLGTLLVCSGVYWFTLAPGVVEIDSGELAAVQYTRGIAHPTGYPLFTWLGWLFTRIPMGISPIRQINLLALLYVTASLGVFWVAFRTFLEKIAGVKDALMVGIIASGATLTLAFCRTYWAQATATEVYSLHLLVLSGLLLCILYIKIYNKEIYWWVLSLLLGLGFSNHMTTLMILPGIAWLYFSQYPIRQSQTWVRLAKMIGLFAGVLILTYGSLIALANSEPVLNWGNPHNLERLKVHVSGWQYRVWLFSSSKVTKANLSEFFGGLSREYVFPVLLLSVAGLVNLFRNNRFWAIFFLICFAFTVLYAANYDIADLDSYFLLAYIALAFLAVAGVTWLLNFKPAFRWGLAALVMALPGWQAATLYAGQDRSEEYVFEDYTRDALNSLPPNALLMSYQWDFLVSPSYYLQQVEGFRKDVCVVDKELLRRSWYYPQMERQYPKVFDRLQADRNEFVEAVTPMELGDKNFDPKRLEFLFRRIIRDLLTPGKYEAYLAIEVMQNEVRNNKIDLPEGYTFIPEKYFMRLVPDTSGYYPLEFSRYDIRFGNPNNSYGTEIRKIAATMAIYRALYEKAAGFSKRAETWKQEALRIKPDFAVPEGL